LERKPQTEQNFLAGNLQKSKKLSDAEKVISMQILHCKRIISLHFHFLFKQPKEVSICKIRPLLVLQQTKNNFNTEINIKDLLFQFVYAFFKFTENRSNLSACKDQIATAPKHWSFFVCMGRTEFEATTG